MILGSLDDSQMIISKKFIVEAGKGTFKALNLLQLSFGEVMEQRA